MSGVRLLYPQQPTFKPHVRFRADCVCFAPESRRGSGGSRESVVDPKPTFGLDGQDRLPTVNFGQNRDWVEAAGWP